MSKSALREFNTAFMQNLVTKKSSSSPKKNSSGVISSRSETDTIISEWYEKNKKGLACACSKQQFKQIATVFIDAYHKTLKEASRTLRTVQGRQSGGAGDLLKIIDILAILCFITALLYSAIQPTIEYITETNMATLNDQGPLGANLTRYLNLTLPPVPSVGSMDIYDSRNHEPVIISFAQKYIAETLSIKRTTISEDCRQPVSFMDSIIDFKSVFDLIPSRTLKAYTATNKKKADEEKYALEHACYSAGIDALELELKAQMSQIVNTRRSGIKRAQKEIEEQTEINSMNNMAMSLALAYLATRFFYGKRRTQSQSARPTAAPANSAEVRTIMRNNYLMLNDGREDISPEERPRPLLRIAPAYSNQEDISPEDRPRSRSRRAPLPSQKYTWAMSPDNPLNQGGGPRRKRTKRKTIRIRKTRKTRR